MARDLNRQRKLERKAKKAAKRRHRDDREAPKAELAIGAARALDEAERLLAAGEFGQGIEELEELSRRYPRRLEVLGSLAEAYQKSGDMWGYQATCARLTAVDPHEPAAWLGLCVAAMTNGQLAVAERACAHILDTWPDLTAAAEARDLQPQLHEFLVDECRRRGMDETLGFRVLLMNDDVTLHLHLGKFEMTCDVATRLLAICPTFAPALNNRSEAHFRSGRNDDAIADSRRILEFDATNYHALANLTRYLYLSGRFAEAQVAVESLKACASTDSDAYVKKAETFATLGDWEAVRQAVDDGQHVWAKRDGIPPLAEHLLGVALANLGDLKAAAKHWRHAADGFDAVNWAKENLEDSKLPIGKRHGAWAFPLEHWVPRGVIDRLLETISGTTRASELARRIERHLDKFPQLELLAGKMLERSDPGACDFWVRLGRQVKRPAIFEALKTFALGQRGSDELRVQALLTLSQAEYLEGEVEVWRDGELTHLALMVQEITSEALAEIPPEIHDLLLAAHDALHEGRGADAERLLDEALRLRPECISAQFNRASSIALQGRGDEAMEIVRRLHREQPEYVFARTQLAEQCIAEGDLERAQSLLAPIAEKRRLHVSEYAASCNANISLAMAKGDRKTALSFLNAWEQTMPDDGRVEIWKSRIQGRRGLRDRFRLLGGKSSHDEE